MLLKNKIIFGIAILLFYSGDLLTTWYGLNNGGRESNIFLNEVGFIGTVVLKTLFVGMVYLFINYFEKHEYYTEIGLVNGAIIVVGLITILNNIGWYS